MPSRLLGPFVVALLLAGCGAGTVPTPAPPSTAPSPPVEPATPPAEPGAAPPAEEPLGPQGSGELEVRRLGEWSQGPFEDPQRLVVRDQATLDRLWADLGAGDPPSVDFGTEQVVAVGTGRRPSGGYDISVAGARRVDGRVIIEVVETTPGPNCMTTMALTSPVELAAVKVSAAERWEWVERRQARDC